MYIGRERENILLPHDIIDSKAVINFIKKKIKGNQSTNLYLEMKNMAGTRSYLAAGKKLMDIKEKGISHFSSCFVFSAQMMIIRLEN